MTTRMDAFSARESNDKAYFTRLGVAFEARDGNGWNLLLDAMPAPVEGQFKIMLRPPRDEASKSKDDMPGDDGPIPF
jgi:hypothetical protein